MAKRKVPQAEPDRFNAVQCSTCKHLNLEEPWSCSAFPDAIPNAIVFGDHDHRQPYRGDNGIRWEKSSRVDDKDVALARPSAR